MHRAYRSHATDLKQIRAHAVIALNYCCGTWMTDLLPRTSFHATTRPRMHWTYNKHSSWSLTLCFQTDIMMYKPYINHLACWASCLLPKTASPDLASRIEIPAGVLRQNHHRESIQVNGQNNAITWFLLFIIISWSDIKTLYLFITRINNTELIWVSQILAKMLALIFICQFNHGGIDVHIVTSVLISD